MLTAPGMSTGQVGDDIAVATDNCDNINNNSCQNFDCNYDGDYDNWVATGGVGDATGGNPVQLGSAYPRVVNLFIVPYQASKGLTGAGDEIPVLGFASFYVMDWGGANSNQDDPCPDTTYDRDGSDRRPRSPCRAHRAERSPASSSRRSSTSPGPSTRPRSASRASSRRAGSRSSADLPISKL